MNKKKEARQFVSMINHCCYLILIYGTIIIFFISKIAYLNFDEEQIKFKIYIFARKALKINLLSLFGHRFIIILNMPSIDQLNT